MSARRRFLAHLAQRCRLRFAATLGDRLGEVGEDDREPEPDLTLRVNQVGAAPAAGAMTSRNQISVVTTLPTSTTNMTGFLATCCGDSLRRLAIAAVTEDLGVE